MKLRVVIYIVLASQVYRVCHYYTVVVSLYCSNLGSQRKRPTTKRLTLSTYFYSMKCFIILEGEGPSLIVNGPVLRDILTRGGCLLFNTINH